MGHAPAAVQEGVDAEHAAGAAQFGKPFAPRIAATMACASGLNRARREWNAGLLLAPGANPVDGRCGANSVRGICGPPGQLPWQGGNGLDAAGIARIM